MQSVTYKLERGSSVRLHPAAEWRRTAGLIWPPDTPTETHTPRAAASRVMVSVAKRGEQPLVQTATPSDVEPEIAAFRRRRDVHIRAERKLTIHTGPNQDEDHGAEHLRRGLPDYFSGDGVRIGSVGLIGAYANRVLAHWFGC